MSRQRLQVTPNALSLRSSHKRSLYSPLQSPRAFRSAHHPLSSKFANSSQKVFVFPRSRSPILAAVTSARTLLQHAYSHRTDYLQIFREWDQQRSGAVHAEDLAAVLTAHGLASDPQEAAAVIASVTPAGVLTANEVKLLLFTQVPQRPSKQLPMPRVCDTRASSEQGLKVLLSFVSLSRPKVMELFRTQDRAGTGKVSYIQFLQVMNSLNVPYRFVNGKNLKALYEKLGGSVDGLSYTSLGELSHDGIERSQASLTLKLNEVRENKSMLSAPRQRRMAPERADEVRAVNRCHDPAIKFYLPRDEASTRERMNYGQLKHFLKEVTQRVLKGFGYEGFVLDKEGFISKHDIVCLLKAYKINLGSKELGILLPESNSTIISLSDLNMRVTRRMYVLSKGTVDDKMEAFSLKRPVQALDRKPAVRHVGSIQVKATAVYQFLCEARLYAKVSAEQTSGPLRLAKTSAGLACARLNSELSELLLPLLQSHCVEVTLTSKLPTFAVQTLDDFDLELNLSFRPEVFEITKDFEASALHRTCLIELMKRFQHLVIESSLKQRLEAATGREENDLLSACGEHNIEAAEPSEEVQTKLLHFQQQGLAWMMQQERQTARLHYLWEVYAEFYFNPSTGQVSPDFPATSSNCRGGILADEPGLGRKLQMIALFHTQPPPDSPKPKRVKQDLGGTLLLTTFDKLRDWTHSINRHSRSLSLLCYTNKTAVTIRELRQVDVVLTTYGLLNYEKTHGSKLTKIPWLRLVLDEGQLITTPAGIQLSACTAVQARHKWILASPQTLDEVQLYLQFLEIEPWSDSAWWNQLLSTKRPQLCSILTEVLPSLVLRRTHKILSGFIEFPRLKSVIIYVTLNPDEQIVYHSVEQTTRRKIQQDIAEDIGKAASLWRHVQKLRRICSDPSQENSQEVVVNEAVAGLLAWVRTSAVDADKLLKTLAKDLDCPLCLYPADQAMLTKCGHLVCKHCLKSQFHWTKSCPLCKTPLSHSGIRTVPRLQFEHKSSSKVEKVTEMLAEGVSTVVVSQWISVVELLSQVLESRHIPHSRVTGAMSKSARLSEVQSFATTKILLATMELVQHEPLHTARLIVMEPGFDTHDRILDAVRPIGHMHSVTVFHLICSDTIEEGIHTMPKGSLTLETLRSLFKSDGTFTASLPHRGILND